MTRRAAKKPHREPTMRDGDLGAGLCGGFAVVIVFLFLAGIGWVCRTLLRLVFPKHSDESADPPDP